MNRSILSKTQNQTTVFPYVFRKIPSREGWREAPGWVRPLHHNPPQGLTALAPPRRGFDRHFLLHIPPGVGFQWLGRATRRAPRPVWVSGFGGAAAYPVAEF